MARKNEYDTFFCFFFLIVWFMAAAIFHYFAWHSAIGDFWETFWQIQWGSALILCFISDPLGLTGRGEDSIFEKYNVIISIYV